MAVDLHTHSRLSDGGVMPAEIIDMAVRRGLTTIALTDHDLIDGIPEAAAAADGRIGFIPGVELSVQWRDRGMHLLAYWVTANSPLADRLAEIQEGRRTRNHEMIEALQALDVDITYAEVEEEAAVGVIGRPHFAGVLERKGYVQSKGQAFEEYLATGRPAYRPRRRVRAEDMIELARESGAVTSVAHPHTLGNNRDEFVHLFPGFAELGVDGVECHYVEYSPEVRVSVAGLAEEAGLIPTGGSDYHERYKPGIEVGIGRGDLTVPDEVVERLSERRGA
jgi:predicted metal-dependent phosphoesterase TrpH